MFQQRLANRHLILENWQTYPTGNAEHIVEIDAREVSNTDEDSNQQAECRKDEKDHITGNDLRNPSLGQVGYPLRRKISLPDSFHGEDLLAVERKGPKSEVQQRRGWSHLRERLSACRERSHDGDNCIYAPVVCRARACFIRQPRVGKRILRRVDSPTGRWCRTLGLEASGQELALGCD